MTYSVITADCPWPERGGGKIKPAKQDRAAKLLKRLGWNRHQVGDRQHRQWVYVRASAQMGTEYVG